MWQSERSGICTYSAWVKEPGGYSEDNKSFLVVRSNDTTDGGPGRKSAVCLLRIVSHKISAQSEKKLVLAVEG